MTVRQYNPIDRFILECDKAIKTVFGRPETTLRPTPGQDVTDGELTLSEKNHSARLMRVNHSGEVSAQALYQGQALTAKLADVKQAMEQAALEENDHLVWCQDRLDDLDSQTSILNPLWYTGSFALGALAGKIGDQWSLGFVAETERQVVEHLDEHLQKMSAEDTKSRAILEQMKVDEAHHGTIALEAGAAALPLPVKALMKLMSAAMTKSSYWI